MIKCIDCMKDLNDTAKYRCQCERCAVKSMVQDYNHCYLCYECLCEFFKNNYDRYKLYNCIVAQKHVKYIVDYYYDTYLNSQDFSYSDDDDDNV
jgi:hypothetical protein